MTGNFVDALITDEKLRDIKIVFITALCSKSGVANPVSFVVTEGEGTKSALFIGVVFSDLAQPLCYISLAKPLSSVKELIRQKSTSRNYCYN